MKSFTTLRNLYGSLSNNTDATNLTLAEQLMNDAIRRICNLRDWPFLEKTTTMTTTASTQFYNLPFDYERLINVTITIGSTKYQPKLAPSRNFWDMLNQSTNITSNIPEWFYIFNGQVGFYPTPSTTTANAITVVYKQRVIDLSITDYSTGTVDVITNGSTTVTGSGTTWTSPMAGRWIKLTPSNVAASSGDGMWYQIASITNATTLVLTRAYNGTSLTTGAAAAYAIGQMSVLPEAYQDLPVYEALEIYFTSIQPEPGRAQLFGRKRTEMERMMIRDEGNKTQDVAIMDDGYAMKNSNLYLTL